jgi:membrane-bound metal-dependent hydrolase YbcI (DUF457 family)
MFIGHAACGFACKRAAPRASLGILLAAPYLADLLWPIFLLLGWERVRIAPGITAMTPLDFVSYPWSHSLLMLIVWGALLGLGYRAMTRDGRGAWIVAALVVSHWVLDVIVHRPDMPLVPWGGPRLGLGLWSSKAATLAVEVPLTIAGVAVYLATTRAKGWVGHVALWSLLGFLGLVYFGDMNAPPPPNERVLAYVGLAGFAFVPWAVWIEHTRTLKEKPVTVAVTRAPARPG